MSEPADVPSSIDLRDAATARAWSEAADGKRPWRAELRGAIADRLAARGGPAPRVLELGAGPGLLAEAILGACDVASYALLDVSPPMLALARERLGARAGLAFVLADMTRPAWTRAVASPFDAVVTMQAVHELRHKRRALALYEQVHAVLAPGGELLVCDHAPMDDSPRMTALYATAQEQHAALARAGFAEVATLRAVHGMYLVHARRPVAR